MFKQGQRVRVLVAHKLGNVRWIVYGRSKRQGYWICHGVTRQIDNTEGFRYRIIIEAEFKEAELEPYEGARK